MVARSVSKPSPPTRCGARDDPPFPDARHSVSRRGRGWPTLARRSARTAPATCSPAPASGPTAAEVARFAPLDRETAVARVLASPRSLPVTTPPAALTDDAPIGARTRRCRRTRSAARHPRAGSASGSRCGAGGCADARDRVAACRARMTLFWHNHFVSSQQKVRSAKLMYRQNATLRALRARQTSARCCTRPRRTPRC